MASTRTSKRERSALRRRQRRGLEPRLERRVPGLDGRGKVGDAVDPADGAPGGPGRGGQGDGGSSRGGKGDDGSSRGGQGDDGLAREEEAERLLEIMLTLANAGNAIDLRIARLAAWIKTADPADCGYSSHTALFHQHVAWSDSWLRSLIRLVESDLTAVQAAVCLGRIPLSLAIKAPGSVDPEQQAWWLEHAQRGDKGLLPSPRCRSRGTNPRTVRTEDLERADLDAIHGARQLARLVSGHPLSNADADHYVLECWMKRVDGKGLVARARRSPPPPPKRTPPLWCGIPDPATPILGPWRDPRDLPHALRLLEQVQVARGSRVLLLGQAYERVARKKLYWEMSFSSLAEMASHGLGCCIRTLERYARTALDIALLPPLARALDDGLDLARAKLVADVACEDTVEDWIRVARSTGVAELRRAVKLAHGGVTKEVELEVLASYQHAIDVAERVVGQMLAADQEDQGDHATEPGGLAPSGDTTGPGAPAPADHATEPGGLLGSLQLFVSLNAAWAPPPVPEYGRVHVDLPEAARWFIENVRIDPQRGFGKVKERDHFTCRNPECGCRNLRVQAHHLHPRSLGGGDELENGITVCKPCHLRLVHTGRISVTRIGGALVWRYPGRVVVAL